MKKLLLTISLSCLVCGLAKAQFTFGNTGLLHMPTAEMNADKTFMFGAGTLAPAATPGRWDYRTFNHYIDITLFPFLEISYNTTLFSGEDLKASRGSQNHFDKWANQDRSFSAKIRLIEEGQFWKYMPQIVIGANDFVHTIGVENLGTSKKLVGFWSSGNGYYGRFFVAATKHFETGRIGTLGVHLAYMYNDREDFLFRGPGVGADYRFHPDSDSFWAKALEGLDLRAEYDSRAFNLGFRYSIWKDHINILGEFYQCKYFSCGLCCKFVLH